MAEATTVATQLVVNVVIEDGRVESGVHKVYLAELPDKPAYYYQGEDRQTAIIMALEHAATLVARREVDFGLGAFEVRVAIDDRTTRGAR